MPYDITITHKTTIEELKELKEVLSKYKDIPVMVEVVKVKKRDKG